MADTFKFVQAQEFTVTASGVAIGATSIILNSFTQIDGTNLTMSDFGSIGYGTLSPNTSREEQISFTGVTQNGNGTATLTGVKTVLNVAPYTETSGTTKSQAGNAVFVISNTAGFYNQITAKGNDETITGNWDFTGNVTVPTPINGTDAVNKDYADSLTIAGAPDASTTVKGISRNSVSSDVSLGAVTITIATPAVVTLASHGLTLNDSVVFSTSGTLPTGITAGTTYYVISTGLTLNTFQVSLTLGGSAVNTTGTQSGTHTLTKTTPISVGTLDPRVPTQSENDALVGTSGTPSTSNPYATKATTDLKVSQSGAEVYASAGGTANAITITLSPVPSAYTTGMKIVFKATATNTGATTINVNSLGNKNLLKGASTTLSGGEIVIDGIYDAVYNGTAFVITASSTSNYATGDVIQQDLVTRSGYRYSKVFVPTTGLAEGAYVYATLEDTFGTVGQPYLYCLIYRNGYLYKVAEYLQVSSFAGTRADVVAIGSYVYLFWYDAITSQVTRLDAQTLANPTSMTGTIPNYSRTFFTDGTDLYGGTGISGGQVQKYTISGTTISTSGGAVTYTGMVDDTASWCNGTNVYIQTSSTSVSVWAIGGTAGTAITIYNQQGLLAVQGNQRPAGFITQSNLTSYVSFIGALDRNLLVPLPR